MVVNSNWTFNEIVDNIKRLKEEYVFFLAFFSLNNDSESRKLYNSYIRNIRKTFYEFNIKEWQIDLCWEYMNDYLEYSNLKTVADRFIDKRTKKW